MKRKWESIAILIAVFLLAVFLMVLLCAVGIRSGYGKAGFWMKGREWRLEAVSDIDREWNKNAGTADGSRDKGQTSPVKKQEKEQLRKKGKEKEHEQEGEKELGKVGVGGETDPAQAVMTMAESVDYIKALPPKNLGLKGDSMVDYEIYAADEMIPVDGLPCTKLSVYRRGEASNTNTFQGIYLLSRDGGRLYRLDPEGSRVTELSFSEK